MHISSCLLSVLVPQYHIYTPPCILYILKCKFFLNIPFMNVLLCLYYTVGCVLHMYWYFCGSIVSLCCGDILN